MTWIAFLMLALPPAPFTPPPAMPKAPAPKAEAKTCLCSPLCVCGCNAGKACRCHLLTDPARIVPQAYRPSPVLPVIGPAIRFVTPGGGRPANC